MITIGNKEFRNIQEQVEKNKQDIATMQSGQFVLDEFGIKVVGQVSALSDLPTVADYKEAHEDWAYGDAYAVGTEPPYELYILTRADLESHDEDYWFDIGSFPAPGPAGENGQDGFSPQVSISNIEGGHSVSITDADGTQTFNVMDGSDGANGSDGKSTKYYNNNLSSIIGDYTTITSMEANVNDLIISVNGILGQVTGKTSSEIIVQTVASLVGPRGEQGPAGPASTVPGPAGADGQDGVTPSITAAATVSNTTGTPSVVVTKTGTDAAPTFTFAFSNIKGEPGTTTIGIQVVASLPATGTEGIIYLVPNTNASGDDNYDEYIYTNGNWELIGHTAVDLSNYIQKSSTSGLVKNDGTIDTNVYALASALNDYVTATSLSTTLNNYVLTSALATVATSGDYNDLLNKPNIPSVNYPVTDVQVNNTTVLDGTVAKISLATVATSGSYNDLTNKPTIPTVDYPVTDVQVDGTSVLDGKVAKITMPTFTQQQANWNQTDSTAVDYIKNKPNLATVATTGDYDDLLNKPTIPTVPTNVSSFTNDAGYLTSNTLDTLIDNETIINDPITGRLRTTIGGSNTDTIESIVETYDIPAIQSTQGVFTGQLQLTSPYYLFSNFSARIERNYRTYGTITVNNTDYDILNMSYEYEDALHTEIASAYISYGGTKNPELPSYFIAYKNLNIIMILHRELPAVPGGLSSLSVSLNLPAVGASNKIIGSYIPIDDSTIKLNNQGKLYAVNSGGGSGVSDVQVNGTSIVSQGVANIAVQGTYDATNNKIATMSEVPAAVTANVTVPSGASDLTSLQVGSTVYSIPSGGSGQQVQANWNESDTTSPAYIQNKPTIPTNLPISYLASQPITLNTVGLKAIVLDYDPGTYFTGYIYFITEA